MPTTKRTTGPKPNTEIYTEGVDPLIVQLRTEQVRQGLSDYALGLATGLSPDRLGKVWRGQMPSMKVVRRVITHLRKGNPAFILRDEP